jgi:glycerophosphoryl diester phosphodiesterase
MVFLAHRGLWRDKAERNSPEAFFRAWAEGFGVETDIRDQDGRLVVSHDPPVGKDVLSLDRFLDLYVKSGATTKLALNIKADGLQEQLQFALADHGISPDCYFVFDMAVPDVLAYLGRRIPCFIRESEFESPPSFINQATGVWLDSFHGDWIDAETTLGHLLAGRQVALVSPELHGLPGAR